MVIQIQFRRDTTVNWAANNPTLAQGEMGLDITLNKFKMGTGSTPWNSLGYSTGTTSVATDPIWTSTNQIAVSYGATAAYALNPGASGQVLSSTSGGTLGWVSRKTFHGFFNRTDSILTWTDTSPARTITITGTYTYYYQGVAVSPGTKTVQVPAGEGLYWIYFSDAAGTLTYSATAPTDYHSLVTVCTVWWNGTGGFIREERHAYDHDLDWHVWAHNTIGCRYGGGLAFTATGTGAAATFTIATGTIWDEDVSFTIPASSAFLPTPNAGRIWYQNSASTYHNVPGVSTTPMYWDAGTSHPYFVNPTTFVLTDVGTAPNRYINVWVYATEDLNQISTGNGTPVSFIVETPSTAVAATLGYTSVANAQAAPPQTITGFGLNPELRLVASIQVRGDGLIVGVVDLRQQTVLAGNTTTIAPASAVSFTPYGYLSGTNVQAALQQVNDTFTLSGSVVGGASFWTSLGTVAYSAATAFTLSGGYSGIVTMTPLKYSISGVTCYGAISMSGTAYSGASTTTMVSIIGVPLVAGASGLTAMSYGDFSRIGQVTIPLTGYWDAVTDSTYLNDRAGLPGGYPWNLPTAYIIGYNFQTGTIDAGTGNYANLVVNGAQFSSLNSNKGLSITTTSNLWTATDLNLISSTNPTISYGQYLDANVTAGTSANATNAVITPVYVIP